MQNLYERYQTLMQSQHLHQREAAAELGVSEGELIAALPQSQNLGNNISEFLTKLEALGKVKSIVRNEIAVSEKIGVYRNLDLSPMMGTAINLGGLDLRLFLRRWHHIFACEYNNHRSFQIFDAHGQAIQKIYLTDDNQIAQWQAICDAHRSEEAPEWQRQPEKETAPLVALSDENIAAYQQEWRELQNVHHFRVVLSQFNIDRLQGLQYAPEGDAEQLKIEAIEAIMQKSVAQGSTLLTFVNNSGMVQIQTGKVHNVVRARGWLNQLDDKEEQFSCHIQDSKIAEFWFVCRPGSNGIVHSFEAYDSRRELVLQFFGRQADASSEPQEWRDLVAEICQEFQAA